MTTSKTILCFGDSNTWGFIPGSDGERYAPEVRWPGVMGSALGNGFRVVEEAQNGRMTAWDDPGEPLINKCGATHLPVVLESQKPIDLVILMLGTNDLKNHMGHNAWAIASGMGALVEIVQASAAGPSKAAPRVLVVAPVPVHPEAKCPFGRLFDRAAPLSRELAAAYREIADDLGVDFLDAGAHASCPATDCIHIDDTGHAAIGRAMAEKVRGMLG
ncbi:MAG: SGNH/GDSL hydrolase family protein [Verrucomicrobiae bacterium]|nr:SGNH/GDSL hydrolase family protein [Verrucomicrobiae bacterium]